jgi:ABC-type lipoprotein export system ATPase subunit
MALLELHNLKKGFRSPDGSRLEIIDIARFTLEEQEQLALAGPSGTGKTTFLNLIAGILSPDSGMIVLNGQELTALSDPARDRLRARTVGYIFQTFNLLQGFTCLENVLLGMSFGPGADREHARALLHRVGLSERLNHFPRQLSSGQQQRVAVARALANRPKLVLADEPTGNLDPVSSQAALELIREACRENRAALLFVTHEEAILKSFANRKSLTEINNASRGNIRNA